MKDFIDVDEKLSVAKTLPLSFQHLFAMFGATVLVPLLFDVSPAIALFMNGIGTLIYTLVTKGKIPSYLGSSFAFLAPTFIILNSGGGFAYAQGGYIVFGIFFVIMGFVIKEVGVAWIDIIMPPAVMGSVVAVIGLELAPVAAKSAGLIAVAGNSADNKTVMVSMFTLFVGIIGTVVFRGFLKIIPILIAVVAGYLFAFINGMVDVATIANAPWFALPSFQAPKFSLDATLVLAPAFIVVLAEHIGHLIVTGNITKKDLMKEPGLHLSLIGDGLSNIVSGMVGSPPNTTYGENIGVMAITKVYSVWVIRGAAILAIIFSCIGKISAAIQTIPEPVMGGVTILLYGVIATSGIRMLIETKVDFSQNYNMVLAAVTFIIGVSGASINIGSVELKGMAFAAVIGMSMSLLFYVLNKLKLTNY